MRGNGTRKGNEDAQIRNERHPKSVSGVVLMPAGGTTCILVYYIVSTVAEWILPYHWIREKKDNTPD